MAGDRRSSRLVALGVVATVIFTALGLRMWFLQVVDSPSLELKVQSNKTRTVKLLPERGRIFDRDGRVLADNERIVVVTVAWEAMRDDDDRVEWLTVFADALERFHATAFAYCLMSNHYHAVIQTRLYCWLTARAATGKGRSQRPPAFRFRA